MKILARDGREFTTVEECLSYEHELDVAEVQKQIYDGVGVKFYEITMYTGHVPNTSILVVHANGNHSAIAEYLITEKLGCKYTVGDKKDKFTSDDITSSWSLCELSQNGRNTVGKVAIEAKTAWIFEADDVIKVFDYATEFKHKCSCGGNCGASTDKSVKSEGKDNASKSVNTDEQVKDDKIVVWRFNPSLGLHTMERIDKKDIKADDMPLNTMGFLTGGLDLADLYREIFERN